MTNLRINTDAHRDRDRHQHQTTTSEPQLNLF
jgi:hypothetical protein